MTVSKTHMVAAVTVSAFVGFFFGIASPEPFDFDILLFKLAFLVIVLSMPVVGYTLYGDLLWPKEKDL